MFPRTIFTHKCLQLFFRYRRSKTLFLTFNVLGFWLTYDHCLVVDITDFLREDGLFRSSHLLASTWKLYQWTLSRKHITHRQCVSYCMPLRVDVNVLVWFNRLRITERESNNLFCFQVIFCYIILSDRASLLKTSFYYRTHGISESANQKL